MHRRRISYKTRLFSYLYRHMFNVQGIRKTNIIQIPEVLRPRNKQQCETMVTTFEYFSNKK
jgi:hypothetical protein